MQWRRDSSPPFAYAGLIALLANLVPFLPAGARALPEGFVYLRDVDATIMQDMRYAGADNFTGRPVPGYAAAECVLRRDVAAALARVQADLKRQNLALKVYDCYRPTRAVRAFARWAHEPAGKGAPEPGKRFYPALDKRVLFSRGYIASHSVHSTGTAIDLTLVPRGGNPTPSPEFKIIFGSPPSPGRTANEAAYGPCTGPAERRAPDNSLDMSLDMGTGFDCFDEKSHTRSRALAPAQARSRALLVDAMRAHGFRNYFREWWHFEFGPRPRQSYDFPIEAR